MKKLPIHALSLIVFLAISILGCKKEMVEAPSLPPDANNITARGPITGAPVPPLDWENISFMPVPPNTTPIPVPWQGGLGGAKIDDDIIFDYKKVNGWELVYNTFTTTARLEPLYFMLYNKYRGVLRTYFYIAPGSNYPSSNINHLLSLRGLNAAASPILNFAAQEIIDFNQRFLAVSQIQEYKVSTSGAWYAAEFELAYDQNTAQIPYDQLRLNWQINPNSITNIVLNGTQAGTIGGTITSTSGNSNFFSSAVNGIISGGLKVGGDSLKNSKLSFLPSFVSSAIISAGTNAVGGLIKGFLSGILGGGPSTSTQKVSLKINTRINITGTATTESQLYDNVFSLPGTQNVINTLPFYPDYTSPTGVFYISAKPIVKVRQTTTMTDDTQHTVNEFQIDDNSFNIIFNPALLNIATIQNLYKEVVFAGNNGIVPTLNPNSIWGTIENVGGDYIITDLHEFSYFGRPYSPLLIKNAVNVRISFDVVPNDGAPKCTIVKTFKATGVSF